MSVRRIVRAGLAIVLIAALAHVVAIGPQASLAAGDVFDENGLLRLDKGRQLYNESCATCHMSDVGVGRFAPPLRAQGLAWFRDVDTMFEYVSTWMPLGNGGSLTDEQYWAIIAFMLAETGLLPDDVQLRPDDLRELSTTVGPEQ